MQGIPQGLKYQNERQIRAEGQPPSEAPGLNAAGKSLRCKEGKRSFYHPFLFLRVILDTINLHFLDFQQLISSACYHNPAPR